MAGKRMKAANASYDKEAMHSVSDAVKIVKGNAKAKFDETIEVAVNLGVDPRHADQMVRGVCNLGMMPNPKVGTVTMDVAKAVKDSKGGAVEFRVEKAGIIHAAVGKASFAQDKLSENVSAFLTAIQKARPSGAKGTFMKRITLSSTMGPGVKIDGSDLSA